MSFTLYINFHCVKSVRIRSCSGLYFPHSDWIRTRVTANTNTFHTVFCQYDILNIPGKYSEYPQSFKKILKLRNYIRNTKNVLRFTQFSAMLCLHDLHLIKTCSLSLKTWDTLFKASMAKSCRCNGGLEFNSVVTLAHHQSCFSSDAMPRTVP